MEQDFAIASENLAAAEDMNLIALDDSANENSTLKDTLVDDEKKQSVPAEAEGSEKKDAGKATDADVSMTTVETEEQSENSVVNLSELLDKADSAVAEKKLAEAIDITKSQSENSTVDLIEVSSEVSITQGDKDATKELEVSQKTETQLLGVAADGIGRSDVVEEVTETATITTEEFMPIDVEEASCAEMEGNVPMAVEEDVLLAIEENLTSGVADSEAHAEDENKPTAMEEDIAMTTTDDNKLKIVEETVAVGNDENASIALDDSAVSATTVQNAMSNIKETLSKEAGENALIQQVDHISMETVDVAATSTAITKDLSESAKSNSKENVGNEPIMDAEKLEVNVAINNVDISVDGTALTGNEGNVLKASTEAEHMEAPAHPDNAAAADFGAVDVNAVDANASAAGASAVATEQNNQKESAEDGVNDGIGETEKTVAPDDTAPNQETASKPSLQFRDILKRKIMDVGSPKGNDLTMDTGNDYTFSVPDETDTSIMMTAEKRRATEDDSRPRKHGRIDTTVTVAHSSHLNAAGNVVVLTVEGKTQLATDLKDISVVQLVTMSGHSAAVGEDGKVYTWGNNEHGALGRPGSEGVGVLSLPLPQRNALQVSIGQAHTAVLTEDGCVFVTGGYLTEKGDVIGEISPTATEVYHNEKDPAIKLASGFNHTAILTRKGKVHTMGAPVRGCLGRAALRVTTRHSAGQAVNPVEVRVPRRRGMTSSPVVDICCNTYGTFLLLNSGDVFAVGCAADGQLGTASLEDFISLVRLDLLAKKKIVAIAAGYGRVLVADSEGHVWGSGRGDGGALGQSDAKGSVQGEDEDAINEWVAIDGLPSKPVTRLVCGSKASFAFLEGGDIWGWGASEKLGTGNGRIEKPMALANVGKAMDVSCSEECVEFVVPPLEEKMA